MSSNGIILLCVLWMLAFWIPGTHYMASSLVWQDRWAGKLVAVNISPTETGPSAWYINERFAKPAEPDVTCTLADANVWHSIDDAMYYRDSIVLNTTRRIYQNVYADDPPASTTIPATFGLSLVLRLSYSGLRHCS